MLLIPEHLGALFSGGRIPCASMGMKLSSVWALSGVVCALAREYFLGGYGVFSWVSDGTLVVWWIWFVGVFPLGGMGVQTLSGVA